MTWYGKHPPHKKQYKNQRIKMSAIQMIISNLQCLSDAEREQVFSAFSQKAQPQAQPKAQPKPEADAGKVKKPNANAGKPTCHGDFVKKICAEHKDEITAYKTANPDMKGAHLVFVGTYKKEHVEEFKAFEAEWKEAHPVAVPEPVALSVATAEPVPVPEPLSAFTGPEDLTKMTGQELRDIWCVLRGKPTGVTSSGKLSNKKMLIDEITRLRAAVAVAEPVPEPKAKMTPEERAAKKAAREAKKAAKAAAEAVVESVVEAMAAPEPELDDASSVILDAPTPTSSRSPSPVNPRARSSSPKIKAE